MSTTTMIVREGNVCAAIDRNAVVLIHDGANYVGERSIQRKKELRTSYQ
jgi:hypothetical protein